MSNEETNKASVQHGHLTVLSISLLGSEKKEEEKKLINYYCQKSSGNPENAKLRVCDAARGACRFECSIEMEIEIRFFVLCVDTGHGCSCRSEKKLLVVGTFIHQTNKATTSERARGILRERV